VRARRELINRPVERGAESIIVVVGVTFAVSGEQVEQRPARLCGKRLGG
jgi:hypothetical protein